ncbi:MAG: M15 family metallopeptidase [Bacteroidetes bacterium]|nr:M15 family metallopeptidase [Bacteroidota bacterium]
MINTGFSISREVAEVSEIEKRMIAAVLVNVQSLNQDILVDLRYSDTSNFMGFDLYGDLNKAFLQPDVAEKLLNAQKFLEEKKPGYHIVVLDAVRPRSVQQLMWDTLEMPLMEKVKFVANPKRGSLHNFGAAVDVTLADSAENVLDMGTPFDYIGLEAQPIYEAAMLEQEKILPEHVENRKLLREVMTKAGFFNIQSEWWHFNSCYRQEAELKYQIIE